MSVLINCLGACPSGTLLGRNTNTQCNSHQGLFSMACIICIINFLRAQRELASWWKNKATLSYILHASQCLSEQ